LIGSRLSHQNSTENALDQLTSRSTSAAGGPTGTVHYLYDLMGHLIAEADAATGATTRDYLWLAANDNTPIDLPLAVAEGATLYQVHTDHLGRPIRMTDSAKATVWQATYKPWGEVQTTSGTKALNLRFPGQVFQIETAYHYNWHRHYDPTTGRYTQPDPLRFIDGPSMYAYAGSSPFIKTDPEGLFAGVIPSGAIPPNNPGGGENTCSSDSDNLIIRINDPDMQNRNFNFLKKVIGEGGGGSFNTAPWYHNLLSGFTKHGINRLIGDGFGRSGVSNRAFIDAIRNPRIVREGFDAYGRPYVQFIGNDAQVIVNPVTGNVVTTNPLSGAGVR
jgi:RHS repeat-associated protein